MAIITYDNFQLVKNGKIERNYAGMLESTAPTFDDSTAYTAGQYVVHNNEIRKFTEVHAAGAWNDSDNEAASLEDVLTDINTAIADKGVTVPSGSKLVDCSELIGSITGGAVSITTRRILGQTGIKVVDSNGYIGAAVNNYFPHTGNVYYNNFAIVVEGTDFSGLGLGQVTFLEEGTAEIGGIEYRTVNIGGTVWMAENLDYKFSGCAIGGTLKTTEPGAWYYDNNESGYGRNGRKCGLLYNGYAAQFLNNNRATLCPGWRLPTQTERNALATAVGGTSVAGQKLKAIDNSIKQGFPSGWNGTDDYMFGALPSGCIPNGNSFVDMNNTGNYWISTTSGSSMMNYYFQRDNNALNYGAENLYWGFSIRLVKDSP